MQQVEIRIRERIDDSWSDWFAGMAISHTAGGQTILTGPVADQSALYGLLAQLRNLGMTLIAVKLKEVESHD